MPLRGIELVSDAHRVFCLDVKIGDGCGRLEIIPTLYVAESYEKMPKQPRSAPRPRAWPTCGGWYQKAAPCLVRTRLLATGRAIISQSGGAPSRRYLERSWRGRVLDRRE